VPEKRNYSMHYLPEKSFFDTKKIIIVVLSLIILAAVIFTLFFINKTRQEYKIKDVKIVVEKNEGKKVELKKGEFKKDDVVINGNKYTKYVYTIEKGDTLWKIAKKFLYSEYAWRDIQNYNETIQDPNWIKTGDQIIIYIPKK
jgi:hypothetical protein